MSILSTIEGWFGGTVAAISTELTTAEHVAINSLGAFQLLVEGGASITDTAAAELKVLVPSLSTAITNADKKVDGWLAALKSEIAKAQAWVEARTLSTSASAEAGSEFSLKSVHIA